MGRQTNPILLLVEMSSGAAILESDLDLFKHNWKCWMNQQSHFSTSNQRTRHHQLKILHAL